MLNEVVETAGIGSWGSTPWILALMSCIIDIVVSRAFPETLIVGLIAESKSPIDNSVGVEDFREAPANIRSD